jgi:hypothetical protein
MRGMGRGSTSFKGAGGIRERRGGGPVGAPHGEEGNGRERVGPRCIGGCARRRNAAGNSPRPSGTGSAVVAEQGRMAWDRRRSSPCRSHRPTRRPP